MDEATKIKLLTIVLISCMSFVFAVIAIEKRERIRTLEFAACVSIENMEYIHGNCHPIRNTND